MSKQVDGETEETVWGGWRPLEDYRDGKLTSRRTYGSGLDEIVRTERDTDGDGSIDSAYAPLYDETGNLALLTLALAQLGAGKPAATPSLTPGSQLGQPVERYSYSAYGERRIFVDSLGPAVEQVRTLGTDLLLELSEEVLLEALETALAEGRLTLSETASGQPLEIALTQPVSTGRQAGRRLLITPTVPPLADTELALTLPADALCDSFGNTAAADFELTFVWPANDGVLFDDTPPRLEQVFLRDGQLELVFSEESDMVSAGDVLQIDGQSVGWTLEEDRYTLRTTAALDLGTHELTASTAPLDLAGQGLAEPVALAFEVYEVPEECPPDTICATPSAPALLFEVPDPREISASAAGNNFGFHGLPHDPETGLVYVRNRYYDPELGRFISADPLGYVDGPSLYGFAGNTPYNSSDPMGLYQIDMHYGLTYYLALIAGFNDWEAWRVATSAQAPDEDDRSPIWNFQILRTFQIEAAGGRIFPWPFPARDKRQAAIHMRKWHFPLTRVAGDDTQWEVIRESLAARAVMMKGISSGNLRLFGEGLHPLQDSFSHEGRPALLRQVDDVLVGFGHPAERGGLTSTTADLTHLDPIRAMDAAMATYFAMVEYRKANEHLTEEEVRRLRGYWTDIAPDLWTFMFASNTAEKREWLESRGIYVDFSRPPLEQLGRLIEYEFPDL